MYNRGENIDDYEQRRLMFEERIANYCLMDDEFFRACMRNNPEAVQLIIRIILNDHKLVVKSMKTQEDMKNLFGKSSWFDVHAIDKLGRHLDVEIQNASSPSTIFAEQLRKLEKFSMMAAT